MTATTRPAFSAELHAALAAGTGGLSRWSQRMRAHPDPQAACRAYLFTLHTIIRASVPLMELARDRASGLGAGGDGVAAALCGYLDLHVVEEEAHDEWLLDDLAAAGLLRSDVLARPPSPTVACLVGAQYYWVLHHHPVALLGYIAVLEGHPPSPQFIDDLERRSGYPPAAFRTLRHHTDVDPGHQADLDTFLDGLALSDPQRDLVVANARLTVELGSRALLGAA